MADSGPYEGILLHLSGGVNNTAAGSSLGGAASQQYTTGGIFTPQTWSRGTPSVTGIEMVSSWGNATGAGTLDFTVATGKLEWTPNGGTTASVFLASDGLYGIGGGSHMLLMKLTSSALPTGNVSETLTITDKTLILFDNISQGERTAGDTEYRCLFVHNEFIDSITGVTVEVVTQPSGAVFSLGAQSLAISDGVSTNLPSVLADEDDSTNLLSGVTWGTSVSGWGTIDNDKYVHIWFRRVFTADGGFPVYDDVFTFRVSFEGG